MNVVKINHEILENINEKVIDEYEWLVWVIDKCESGADLGFSRGGRRIFKKFSKILTTFFFLGRSDWFSELSQSSKKTLFWPNFLRRRQFFEKKVKKAVFGHFENLTKKIAFFLARGPPQN